MTATHQGFATASTDTGHKSVTTDASWALDNEETRLDWGWRAIHGTVEYSKKLVAAYYTKGPAYSYYSGCSTGGRQGLRELQGFPDSFDGAIIGAPAWNPALVNNYLLEVGMHNLPGDDPKHITKADLGIVAEEVARQCDDADGVSDGIISAPERCNVDFAQLSCDNENANATRCLTAPQIETVRKIYADSYADGELAWSGYSAGSEREWTTVIGGDEPSPFGTGFQRYFVHDDAERPWQSFNKGAYAAARAKNPGKSAADKYDLSEFRDRGGKIILYHGTSDGLLPLGGSTTYYSRVTGAMGGPPTDFFRYFQVPGMQHCWSTPVDAPWYFAAPFHASILGTETWSVPGFEDSRHDILLALRDWVEEGTAVDSLVATTWKVQNDSSSGVLRQRPLCPYPAMAVYDGEGNVDEAGSWSCAVQDSEDGPGPADPEDGVVSGAAASGVGLGLAVLGFTAISSLMLLV
jgi:feruloyl esterase